VWSYRDITERRNLESQLRHAQKLEAVGQLAAGIAHEINTPTQFVGDNLSFLSNGFNEILRVLANYRRGLETFADQPAFAALAHEIAEVEEAADVEYIEENAPAAFERAKDGLSRIAKLVSAMKEFAHPDHREKELADLNRALRTTLTIAKNEYKYVADVDEDYGDLPLVQCHLSDINQVFLNLVVNAAHAIGEVIAKTGGRGRIAIRSIREGEAVCISISDTGCGIRQEIRDRVFDPFFTTKPVGKGTGQGLAIARSIVVDKHGGALRFESEVGKGTTFTIRLPVGNT
jgi:signal transduction histidine kinase